VLIVDPPRDARIDAPTEALVDVVVVVVGVVVVDPVDVTIPSPLACPITAIHGRGLGANSFIYIYHISRRSIPSRPEATDVSGVEDLEG
jgi:hypothetical protein